MGEIKPTGEGLANRECGRPDYADLPSLALNFMAQGFPYWEEGPEQDKVELCHILDRLFEAIEFSGDFLGFARLIGQAMAGMSVYMLGHRSARWHGYETYDSVPRQAVERWAATYTEGAAKYGAYNWRKGLKIRNLLSHAIGHVYLLADDNRSEDHFGHFLWNCGTAIWMAKNRPELDDRFGSPLAPKVAVPVPVGTFPILSESLAEARAWAKTNSGVLGVPADFPSHQCRVGSVAVCAESDKAALRWADAHNVPHDLIIRVDKLSQLRDLPPGTYVVDLLETCIGLLPARLWLVRSEVLQHVASGKFVMWEDTVSVVGV